MNNRLISLFIAGIIALSSCSSNIENGSETNTVSDDTTAVADVTNTEVISGEIKEDDTMSEDEIMYELGLSITDGNLPLDRESIFSRFKDYSEIGVKCVRIDTFWDTSIRGTWTPLQTTADYFDAAKEYGLKIKAILPTVMAPPNWLYAEEGARLVDENGKESVLTVSYWYDGIEDYTKMALNSMLNIIKSRGWDKVITAVVCDMGPAGEPLYPPAWTQGENGTIGEVMWCYGNNAVSDFRDKMKLKYEDIAAANTAWGTSFEAFDGVIVPKPNTVSGALWEDTLVWYRDTKRQFMKGQVEVFKACLNEKEMSDKKVIIYLPGADMTEKMWRNCITSGSATAQIKLCCDNQYAVKLADETGCLLQYTGINDEGSLRILRRFMYENGYGDIPVFGENAGAPEAAGDIKKLERTITDYKLWGIDYTHSCYIYNSDGRTHGDNFEYFVSVINGLTDSLKTLDITETPSVFLKATPTPDGDIIAFQVDFDKPANENVAFAFLSIGNVNHEVMDGDTIEYDVKLSDEMHGLGAIDGNFVGGATIRDSYGITDDEGTRAHPNADLSTVAFPDWYHRTLYIGNANSAGSTIREFLLAAHPENNDGAFTAKSVTVYYDNIVIKRNGEIIVEIFRNDGDVKLRKASLKQYAIANAEIVSLESIN